MGNNQRFIAQIQIQGDPETVKHLEAVVEDTILFLNGIRGLPEEERRRCIAAREKELIDKLSEK